MQDKPFFSVVMPVYNVEKYLEQAINSVLAQTFSDFELILVDDCSTDASSGICSKMQESDQRVKAFFLPKNSGASYARTVGLSKACGQYILFMDSDDTLSADLFSAAFAEIKEFPADIVMYDALEVYVDDRGTVYDRVEVRFPQKRLQTSREIQKEVISIEKTTLFGYLWNKFYKAELLQRAGIAFENMPLNEDFKYNIDVFPFAETFSALGLIGYQYYKRENVSLTGRFVKNYFELQMMRIQYLTDFYKRQNLYADGVAEVLCAIYVRSLYSALQRNMDSRAEMNRNAQKAWLLSQYQTDMFRELMPYSNPSGKLQTIMSSALQKQNTPIVFGIARVIYFIKVKFPTVFAKLKANRS
ncbi:MAG: glycosyltransferase family 2 protein [Candidatus Fimenecus sp.]